MTDRFKDYQIIRSRRRTIGIEVKPEGVIVRAPLRASKLQIQKVVDRHSDWIHTKLSHVQAQKDEALREGILSPSDIRDLADQARTYIPGRVAFYAPMIGVHPGRITIRKQKTRWGSCSSKGNLNFNCLLMLAPPQVIDSVVVHELCHLKEMNHSRQFYQEVVRVFPEYHQWDRWLKEHGGAILRRVDL